MRPPSPRPEGEIPRLPPPPWGLAPTALRCGDVAGAPSPAPYEPIAAVASCWSGDPDIASAYSYLRPGGTPADRDLLATPLAPGLHFAGEATWSAHPGTMHGAWWSGERAARRVLDDTVLDDTAQDGPAPGAFAAAPGGLVVVIGAGLAGLAAARLLADSGRPVVVLEAGDRPGGRARADTSLGVPVHLGASWAHGSQGNPLVEAAARAGVRTEPTRPARRPTVVAGRGVLRGAGLERLEAARARIEEATGAAGAALPAGAADQPVGLLARGLVEAIGRDEEDRLVLWSWVRNEYEALYSAPVDDLSLRYRSEPYMLPGDNLTVLDSLDLVMADLARGLDVQVRRRVRTVEALQTHERLEAPRAARRGAGAGARWLVGIEGGASLAARSVIVTVPIGALAAGRVRFDPPLHASVRSALGRIGPGTVAKVAATFTTDWWAPHRSFTVVSQPRPALPVWFDVSELAGVPALAAFAAADAVPALEAASPGELITVVRDVLRHAHLGLVLGPTDFGKLGTSSSKGLRGRSGQ
ncbi:MAG: NAD(P)-binding protein [Acidimicrobiia bacterium]|nr:NAD(P)-binding protein [Acidimicrobiia bacterium]